MVEHVNRVVQMQTETAIFSNAYGARSYEFESRLSALKTLTANTFKGKTNICKTFIVGSNPTFKRKSLDMRPWWNWQTPGI